MKTKYEYIPVIFENRADAIELVEDGKLFVVNKSSWESVELSWERVNDWIYAGNNFNRDGFFFTRESVELPTPKEALKEFLENSNVVGITEVFGSFLNNGNHEYDKKWDKEFIAACCAVADAHRALMENDE